jgi:serine phosphatase RsbU (regulator of sigma subunit)/tetratricopeptide (TPR) repeat protein
MLPTLSWGADKDRKLDSLRHVYATTRIDTVRVLTGGQIARMLVNRKGEIPAAMKYTDEIIALSQKIGYQKGLAVGYINKGIVVSEMGKKEEAIQWIQRAVKITQATRDIKTEGVAYTYIGRQYKALGNYKKSLDCYNYAVHLAQKRHDDTTLADLHNSIGTIYEREGNFPQALYHFQKSRRMNESIGQKNEIGIILINLGNIYEAQNDLRTALSYYRQAEALMRKTDKPKGISNALNNIGTIYKKQKKYKQVLACYEESLTIAEGIKSESGIATVLNLIGDFYFETKELPKAIEYYTRSLALSNKQHVAEGTITALLNLGASHYQLKNYPLAKKYILEGFTHAQKIHQLQLAMRGAQLLAQTDSVTQNFRSAYNYKTLYHMYRDSMYNADQAKAFGNLESQYRYEKEKFEREQKEREAEKKRTVQYAIFGGIFLAVLMLVGFLFYNNRSKQRTNKLLASQNAEIQKMNHELANAVGTIQLQNEEISNAYEELNATLEQVQEQKEVIVHKNQKIEDSIRYAYQIQTAILPDDAYLKALLPHHFIFYQPKDIVSGDFYWVTERENLIFFCVADCTGHGVPGAFMSVVSSNALHTAVNELGLTEPEVILHEADRKIRHTLRQEKSSESKDGMDVCLCVFDTEQLTLQFAGAGRPLYHLSNGNLSEIKGDKFPIGGGQHENKTFTAHHLSLQSGDRIYLFSDGITDQFGGANKKKFTPKRLQEFILNHQSLTISEQGAIFHQTMHDWMRGQVQLDDLTLMAVEV